VARMHSMPHANWGPRVLALAILVGAAMAFSAGSAKAYNLVYYCNIYVQPYSACTDNPPYAPYDFNHAEYDGSYPISVCEHTYGPDYNTVSRRCNYGVVGSGSDLDYYWAHRFYLHLYCGNNYAHAHTIFCWGQQN